VERLLYGHAGEEVGEGEGGEQGEETQGEPKVAAEDAGIRDEREEVERGVFAFTADADGADKEDKDSKARGRIKVSPGVNSAQVAALQHNPISDLSLHTISKSMSH
jgi:hypothetical protein